MVRWLVEVLELAMRILFPVISDALDEDILSGERLLFLLLIGGNNSIGIPLSLATIS
jgi:hypothetical protein